MIKDPAIKSYLCDQGFRTLKEANEKYVDFIFLLFWHPKLKPYTSSTTPDQRPRYRVTGTVRTTAADNSEVGILARDTKRLAKRDEILHEVGDTQAIKYVKERGEFKVVGGLDAGDRFTAAVVVMTKREDDQFNLRQLACRKEFFIGPSRDSRLVQNHLKKASIVEVENSIVAGKLDDDFEPYAVARDESFQQLSKFYGSSEITRLGVATKRERRKRYDIVCNKIIEMLGLSSSGKNDQHKLATTAFCFGSADFQSNVGGYPSLHKVFERFLAKKLRGLGVAVFAVDEWLTSQVR